MRLSPPTAGARFTPKGDVGSPGIRWYEVPSPLYPPHRLLCAIKQKLGPRRVRSLGTGGLLGPRLLLTAAHVVDVNQAKRHDPQSGLIVGQPAKLFAICGLNKGRHHGSLWVRHVVFLAPAARAGAPEDLAIAVLQDPAPQLTEFLTPLAVEPRQFHKRLVRVAGYPVYSGVSGANGNNIMEGVGRGTVDEKQPHKLLYDLDTQTGHSGAPVFVDQEGQRYHSFVGIHVADQYQAQVPFNMGLCFTLSSIEWIRQVAKAFT